jgi:hypothetical protein
VRRDGEGTEKKRRGEERRGGGVEMKAKCTGCGKIPKRI